ncbi:unnamed protein product [Sphagnum jensenii]|uniref:TROVE domain-containing protein n=1 Tax=Sphagnum jensenii TaxID=128206 RepID=A0ABP0V694_9BRYO
MSSFINAMDTSNNSKTNPWTQRGENGTVEYTAEGVGDTRVALSFALVRNIPTARINTLVEAVVNTSKSLPIDDAAIVAADLLILTFQTRDCRGGKGEKAIFDEMLLNMFQIFPRTVTGLLHLIPKYGSYKDIFRLLNRVSGEEKYALMVKKLVAIVAKRLTADGETLAKPLAEGQTPRLSLCAKYAPREGKALSKGPWFETLRTTLFPAIPSEIGRKKLYRKLLARLTLALDVPEVKMSGKRFREIDFTRVPSVCVNKFRKAFLNELVERAAKKGRGRKTASAMNEETGNRYPDDPDRVECRQHLKAAVRAKGVHGKQLQPHLLVVGCMKPGQSSMELLLFDAQWAKIREDLVSNLSQKDPAPGAVDFRKLVPLVDVSGSMSGDPMHAAIALGILTSEVNHPLFRDRLITFESTPQWVDLSACATIHAKVAKTAAAPWGGSTNIDAAFELILKVVEKNKLPATEVPDLIIFSDMQFDVACGGRGADQTQLAKIQQRFAEVGNKISGKPYPSPRIVFWNLRGDTSGFPAQANSPNVQLLSGFSPALLKLALSGEPVVPTAENGNMEAQVDPYETFRKMVDDERYDAVRLVINKSNESCLAHYHFTPAVKTETNSLLAPTTELATAPVEGKLTMEDSMDVTQVEERLTALFIVEDTLEDDDDWLIV